MASIFRMEMIMRDLMNYAPLCGGKHTLLCDAVGITRKTYKKWEKEANELIEKVFDYEEHAQGASYQFTKEEKLLTIFYEKVVLVVARAKIEQLEKIIKDPDWRSGAWFLERTEAQEFGKRRDVANIDEFSNFVKKYFGPEALEALQFVWSAIEQGKESRTKYDEDEALDVNTFNRSIEGQSEDAGESSTD